MSNKVSFVEGKNSFAEGSEAILDRVYEVIRERQQQRPAGSYVVSLLDGGLDAIAAKVREEAAELIEAASEGDLDHAR